MELARLNCFDSEIFDCDSPNVLLRFEERRKCLNTVFWWIHESLRKAQSSILLVDKENDLEYLNYFLSKFKIQSLAVLLAEDSDFMSWFTFERLVSPRNMSLESNDFEEANENLYFLLQRLQRNISEYYDESLGQLNLFDVIKRVESIQAPKMPLDVYQLVSFENYKEKKKLILQAEQIFKKEFRFNDDFKLFNPVIFNEYKPESQLVILKHFKEQVLQVLKIFEDLEMSLLKEAENKLRDKHQAVRKKMLHLEHMIATAGNDRNNTLQEKIAFQFNELKSQLNKNEPELNSIHTLEELKQYYTQHMKNELSHLHAEMDIQLRSANRHTMDENAEDMFQMAEKVFEDIANASIFSSFKLSNCSSFFHFKKLLLETKNLLDKAAYIIKNNQELLQWHVFYESLEINDRRIIDELLDIDSNWVECFEYSYLSSFVSNKIMGISSVSELHPKIIEAYKDVENLAYQGMLANFENEGLSDIKYSEKGNREDLLWTQLLTNYGDFFSRKFPLFVMRSSFYERNKDLLTKQYKQVIYLNSLPKDVFSSPDIRKTVVGYTDDFLNASISHLKNMNDLEVFNIKGVEFNINRSAQYLSNSELANLSLYLAQGIEYFNSSYRIFQFRDASILSLMTDERNRMLIERLGNSGIKEIFTEDASQNLIPALFGDKQRKTFVLLEDYLLNTEDQSKVLNQKLFIDKLQIAGVRILNVDNYHRLMGRRNEIDKISQIILEPESHITLV